MSFELEVVVVVRLGYVTCWLRDLTICLTSQRFCSFICKTEIMILAQFIHMVDLKTTWDTGYKVLWKQTYYEIAVIIIELSPQKFSSGSLWVRSDPEFWKTARELQALSLSCQPEKVPRTGPVTACRRTSLVKFGGAHHQKTGNWGTEGFVGSTNSWIWLRCKGGKWYILEVLKCIMALTS